MLGTFLDFLEDRPGTVEHSYGVNESSFVDKLDFLLKLELNKFIGAALLMQCDLHMIIVHLGGAEVVDEKESVCAVGIAIFFYLLFDLLDLVLQS